MECTNAMRYEGEWQNGLYHGQGTLERENGAIFQGGWENGMMKGYG